MTQTFVESCVDFEVAHLSILMVWRLAYLEIPTLSVHGVHGVYGALGAHGVHVALDPMVFMVSIL